MAEKRLKFDEPSVPISQDNITAADVDAAKKKGLIAPSVPISQDNITAADVPPERRLKFDEPTEQQKSAQRIREIAATLKKGEPYNPGPLDYTVDAATLSTARPISALVGAATGGLANSYPGSNFEERYKANIQYLNDRMSRAEQATGPIAPAVGAVASLPANMAMPGARGATAPLSTARVAGQSAIPGFIEGASQNAGSLQSAAEGGAKNALLSAGVSAGADRIMKGGLPAARRGAEAEATAARGATPDEIRTNAKTHFDVLDNNGIEYSAQQTANLYTSLHQLRQNHTYVPGASTALDNLFDDTMTRARQGMTFNDLDNARSAIATLARGPDESTRVAARAINNEIDRMIGSGPPAINPNNVNVQDAYEQARSLWRQKSLVEDAMFHADNVDRKMAINSSADPNKAMKSEFGAVEKQYAKPGAYNPLENDPEGRELLARLVRGDRTQNAMASVGNTLSGRFAPWAAGAAGIAIPTAVGISKNVDPMLATSLGGVFGASAGGAVNQAGKAFNRGAANRGEEAANAYTRHLSGSPAPVPGAAIDRNDLAQILFAQDLERLAPRVGSTVIGHKKEEEDKKKK